MEDKAKAVIQKMYHTQNNKQKIHNIYLAEKAACNGGEEEGDATGGQVTMK